MYENTLHAGLGWKESKVEKKTIRLYFFNCLNDWILKLSLHHNIF